MNNYIPREYLALRINYCRQQLEKLPEVVMHENKNCVPRYVIGKHRYLASSDNGKHCLELMHRRELIQRELRVCQALWDCYFKGEVPADCRPQKINRKIYVDYNKAVVMDKAYFDSLEHDANTNYPKNPNNFFNGTYYRSAAEREIACFYTEMGIPFKYEPNIRIVGVAKPINPDFVLYFKEIDSCKIHEHLGLKNSSDYNKNNKIKYNNLLNAGLTPDLDFILTHETDDLAFDIRSLRAMINTAVYNTLVCVKPDKTIF